MCSAFMWGMPMYFAGTAIDHRHVLLSEPEQFEELIAFAASATAIVT